MAQERSVVTTSTGKDFILSGSIKWETDGRIVAEMM